MAHALNASCLSSWFVSFRCIRISFLWNYFYRAFCHISKEKHISRFRIKWIFVICGSSHTYTYQHDILFGISRTSSSLSHCHTPIYLSLFCIQNAHPSCSSFFSETVWYSWRCLCFFFRVVKTGNWDKQMKTGQHPRQSPHLSFEYHISLHSWFTTHASSDHNSVSFIFNHIKTIRHLNLSKWM